MKRALIIASVASMIEQFNMNNIKLLQKLGYEVDVATNFESSGTITSTRSIELKEELKEINVKQFQIDFSRSVLSKSNLKAYKQLKKIIKENNYELIHMHSPIGGVCGRLAAKKARKNGTKVIYTAHGFHFYKGASLLNWIIFYPIEKYLSKFTDCLITINQEDYELAKKKFKAKRTELIHGVGVDKEKFNFQMSEEDKHKLKESLGLKEDAFVLIQIGELNKNKNQIMSINAMRQLIKENSNIHLLLVGIGPLEDFYKQKIEEYNLSKNVHMLGYRKDIPNLMKISNVLLSLSHREGLPVNVMEALISGLPAIVSNCRGNIDLIRDGENGYIVKSQENLVTKIKDTINLNRVIKTSTEKFEKRKIDKVIKDLYVNITKQKVLHILASNKYSGAESVAISIIKNMREKKIESIYISPDGKIREKLDKEKIFFQPIKKVSIKEIKNICKKYKPDIIHAHDFTTSVISAFSGANVKIISHLHHNASWIKRVNIKSLLYLFSSVKYRKIILVSESIYNEYIFSKLIRYKIKILGNPIDCKTIREKSDEENIKKKFFDVVFVGRLEKEKDPIRFIEIIKRIKEEIKIKVAIVGDGNLKDECNKKIKELNLSDTIEMLGFIDNPYPIINNAKILCMTSKWEGFGLVAVEALALKVPVVATAVGGLTKLVDNSCGKLCINNDDFCKEINALIKDKNYYNKKSENAFLTVKKLENIKEYINNLLNIYREDK